MRSQVGRGVGSSTESLAELEAKPLREPPGRLDPLFQVIVATQFLNGLLLPIVLIFVLKLVNDRDLMGEHVNTLTFNIVAWVTAVAMIVLTLVLVYTSLFQSGSPPAG